MTDYRPLLDLPIQTEPSRKRWSAPEIVAVLGAFGFVVWLGFKALVS